MADDELPAWLRVQLDEDERDLPSCDHMDYRERWTIGKEVEVKR